MWSVSGLSPFLSTQGVFFCQRGARDGPGMCYSIETRGGHVLEGRRPRPQRVWLRWALGQSCRLARLAGLPCSSPGGSVPTPVHSPQIFTSCPASRPLAPGSKSTYARQVLDLPRNLSLPAIPIFCPQLFRTKSQTHFELHPSFSCRMLLSGAFALTDTLCLDSITPPSIDT